MELQKLTKPRHEMPPTFTTLVCRGTFGCSTARRSFHPTLMLWVLQGTRLGQLHELGVGSSADAFDGNHRSGEVCQYLHISRQVMASLYSNSVHVQVTWTLCHFDLEVSDTESLASYSRILLFLATVHDQLKALSHA